MEVQPDEAIRAACRPGELRWQQGRRIGREDRPRRTQRVKLGQQSPLEVRVLRNGFTEQIGVSRGQRCLSRDRDLRQGRIAHLLGDDPVRDQPVRVSANTRSQALKGRRRDVVERDRDPMPGALKRDLVPHRPRAHDRDLIDLLRDARRRRARFPLRNIPPTRRSHRHLPIAPDTIRHRHLMQPRCLSGPLS
jgi:hypothetical protein